MAKEKDRFDDKKTICASVFKSGESTTTKEIYTQKWVELIHTLERRKQPVLISGEIRT